MKAARTIVPPRRASESREKPGRGRSGAARGGSARPAWRRGTTGRSPASRTAASGYIQSWTPWPQDGGRISKIRTTFTLRLCGRRVRRSCRPVDELVQTVAFSVDRLVLCLPVRSRRTGRSRDGLGMILGRDPPLPDPADSPHDQPVMDGAIGEPVADQVGARQGPEECQGQRGDEGVTAQVENVPAPFPGEVILPDFGDGVAAS